MPARILTALTVLLAVQGCSTFTYPGPRLATAAAAGEPVRLHVAGAPWPVPGIEALCHPALRGATHERIEFSVQDTVGFCFLTPSMGSITSAINPGLTFTRPCQRGAAGGIRNASSELTFTAGVVATRGTLGTERVTGTLQLATSTRVADTGVASHDGGYTLTFRFPLRCDPDAAYRLTIDGLTLDGNAITVPAVDFLPTAETTSAID